jgi:chromosome segregation ATPase
MDTTIILSRLNNLKEEEKKVTDEVKGLLDRFNSALDSKEKERLGLEDEIIKLKANRDETKENLRTANKNILVYGFNLDRVRQRLGELEQKGASVKKYYEGLLMGPVPNIITVHNPSLEIENQEVSTADLKETDSRPLNSLLPPLPLLSPEKEGDRESIGGEGTTKPADDSKKIELLKKRKELMTAMDTIFSKYETEIKEIEDEKKRLRDIEDTIVKKDEGAKRQKEILTNSFIAYSSEIKRCMEKLQSSANEEIKIIGEFYRIIKGIDKAAIIVSKDVSDILNKLGKKD